MCVIYSPQYSINFFITSSKIKKIARRELFYKNIDQKSREKNYQNVSIGISKDPSFSFRKVHFDWNYLTNDFYIKNLAESLNFF